MANAKIPINQQNALPILTIDQTASPGDMQIIGNTMTKFWSSSVLGGFVTNGGASLWLSPQLDVRACSRFAIVMKRTYSVDRTNSGFLFVDYAFSDGTANSAATIASNPGSQLLRIGSWSLPLALPSPFVFAFQWTDPGAVTGTGAGPGANPYGATLGTNIRFCITNAQPIVGTDTIVLEMWGGQ